MIDNEDRENANSLGKGEVESSILSHSTIPPHKSAISGASGTPDAQTRAERRENMRADDVENRWNPFTSRSPESSADDVAHPATSGMRHPYRAPQLSGDACANCGNFSLVRSGTCLTCHACGETTGCS